MKRIYLDNNATTAIDDTVLHAVIDELHKGPANPSSTHTFGQAAKARLIEARLSIAKFFQVNPQELIFTSSATEGMNMLLQGMNLKNGHIITSNVEHPCVYNTLKSLEKEGHEVSFLEVGESGAVDPSNVEFAIRPNTKLIVLMAVNNETGVKTDLEKISFLAQKHNIPLIVDAVALIGKEPFILYPGISALVFSGHKFHAPKGIGCTIVRKGLKFRPLIQGGPQEHERRSGTENLAAIVGLAKAIDLLKDHQTQYTHQMKLLRDRLEEGLLTLGNVTVNGTAERISNTTNLCFHGIDGETLLMQLDLAGILASHGSACSSGALEPSRVLINMTKSRTHAKSSLRFSLSRQTTADEIEQAIATITSTVQALQKY